MAKNRKSTSQGNANVEESIDRKLVQVLENTVEGEVLRNIKKPLEIVVHKAVIEAIRKAAKVVAPQEAEHDATVMGNEEPHRPSPGGRCAAVWDELDHMRQDGAVPTLKEILAIGRRKKWNLNNTRIEYYQWRRFHGIHGRVKVQRDGRWLDRRVNVSSRSPRGIAERRSAA